MKKTIQECKELSDYFDKAISQFESTANRFGGGDIAILLRNVKDEAMQYASQSQEVEFELRYCDKCNQMTNHIKEDCQKCKVKQQVVLPETEVTEKDFRDTYIRYKDDQYISVSVVLFGLAQTMSKQAVAKKEGEIVFLKEDLKRLGATIDEIYRPRVIELEEQLKSLPKAELRQEGVGLLNEVEEFLTHLEDFTHGKDGNTITELRSKIKNLLATATEKQEIKFCKCVTPIIRNNGMGIEYCGICQKDLEIH